MRLYTAKEAAAILRVSKQTIWKYGREGKVDTIRFGRTVRFNLKMKEEANEVQDNAVRRGVC